MNTTIKTKQVEFTSEGRESHDWGFCDKKGRALGSFVALSVQVFEQVAPDHDEIFSRLAPGTYFCWVGRATRAGEVFGGMQSWQYCKTEAERKVAVAKYLTGARGRAQRWAV